MIYVWRHYGSCGHVVDEESKELFDRFAKPRAFRNILGQDVVETNEITVEGDKTIVHVVPDRFCLCRACCDEELDYAQREYDAWKAEQGANSGGAGS